MAWMVRDRAAPVSVALLLLLGAGMLSVFAAPDEHRALPALPPIALPHAPDRDVAGRALPGSPAVRAKAGACDGAAEAIATGPRPLTAPQSWFSSDDYPMEALIAARGGLTQADLVVDAGGAVIGCGVSGTSGHYSLDTKSCLVFRQRARFAPAEDARGCPVPSVWHQRVRWVIPPG